MSTKNIIYLLLALCIFGVSSCKDEDQDQERIVPSKSKVTLEAEGGEFDIQLNNDNWHIAGIVNKDGGDVGMFGKIYSPDGEKIRENVLLELKGLGKLEVGWMYQRISISRQEPTVLKIAAIENTMGQEFNIGVILQNEEETKEIVIAQKKSQGYTLDKIEYKLQEGDKDSLYFKNGSNSYITISSGMTLIIQPFSGSEKNISYFESNETDAFLWLEKNPVGVKVPVSISNGEILLSEDKHLCGEFTRIPYINNVETTIVSPMRESHFYIEHEWRARKVSYTLTLTNNRTGDKKIIQGQWIEDSLTGNYNIKNKMEETN